MVSWLSLEYSHVIDHIVDSRNRTAGLTGTGTGQGVPAEAGTAGSHRTGTSSLDYPAGIRGTSTTSNQFNDPRSSNAGPHTSNLANKADPRIDSDLDSSRNTTGVIGTSTSVTDSGMTRSSNTSAGHSSGIKGKFDDLVHGGPHHTETANRLDPHVFGGGVGSGGLEHASVTGQGSATAGPHSSNLANKADPRVDSDLDGSRDTSARGTFGGLSSSGKNTGHTGSHGLASNAAGTTFGATAGTTAGPHSSNLTNKVDPRVDSDYDGSRNMGAAHGTTSGLGSATGATGSHGATGTTADPHSSNFANKADPRVDSDRDGSRNIGAAHGTTSGSGLGTSGGVGTTDTPGHHGTTTSTGPAGNYGSTTGTGAAGTTGGYSSTLGTSTAGTAGTAGTSYNTSTGPATSTAGPHKSNLLNKLDPRIDSDLDGKPAK